MKLITAIFTKTQLSVVIFVKQDYFNTIIVLCLINNKGRESV